MFITGAAFSIMSIVNTVLIDYSRVYKINLNYLWLINKIRNYINIHFIDIKYFHSLHKLAQNLSVLPP